MTGPIVFISSIPSDVQDHYLASLRAALPGNEVGLAVFAANVRTARHSGQIPAGVDELEKLIAREGADTIAAFIGEPVMGTGGILPPPAGYWTAIQQVLKQHCVFQPNRTLIPR